MRKIIGLVLGCLSVISVSNAQTVDTLESTHWNIYNFSGNASAANPNRVNYIRTVLQYVKPDIFTVNEMESVNGSNTILNRVLNQFGETRYRAAAFMATGNSASNDTYSQMFYRSDKFRLLSQYVIPSNPRGVAVFRMLYLPSVQEGRTDSAIIQYYVYHPKASNTASDRQSRAATAQSLMNDVRNIPNRLYKNAMIQADLNLYGNLEQAYTLVTDAAATRTFRDPLNGDFGSQLILTQSPRNSQFDGGVNGGLDSRFDFQFFSPNMLSDTAQVRYLANSYRAIGNDGRANGGDIVMVGNRLYPDSVATGVYYGSDHLPVSGKLLIRLAPSSVGKVLAGQAFLKMSTVNPAQFNLMGDSQYATQIEIFNTAGQRVSMKTIDTGASQSAMPQLVPGNYLLRAVRGQDASLIRFVVTQ